MWWPSRPFSPSAGASWGLTGLSSVDRTDLALPGGTCSPAVQVDTTALQKAGQ